MDQVKIGRFMATIRKEHGLSQEQLADKIGVSRRTVSRWETGNNMPDMDILIELSDFYSVDLREILDGERKNATMDKEMEETILKVSEYENEVKRRTTKITIVFSIIGIVGIIANLIIEIVAMSDTFLTGVLKGMTMGVALFAMFLSVIYATGKLAKLCAFKKRLLKKNMN